MGTDSDLVADEYESKEEKVLLEKELKNLEARDKEIMIMRYGLYNTKEYTQKEVANMLGISQSYISRIEKKVINEITKREQTKLIEANAELELPLPEAQLVFVKDNGQFLGTDSPKYAFKVIHYELGINSRFHDFRDTHATKLIESGADIKAVSKRLGHSTIQTTYNIYVRVTNKMESDTVDRFEKYTTTLDIPQTAEIPYQV